MSERDKEWISETERQKERRVNERQKRPRE
jgi:hypothetical protein